MPKSKASGVRPVPAPKKEVPISKEQLAMLVELDNAVAAAAQRRDLMLSAILAGHGITGNTAVRLDASKPALVVS